MVELKNNVNNMNPNSLETLLRRVPDENTSSVNSAVKSDKQVISQRPLLITLICGYFFVHWIYSIYTILMVIILRPTGGVPSVQDILAQVGPVFLGISQTPLTLIIAALALATIVGIIGLWLMQRWALIIYGAGTIALFIFALRQITGEINSAIIFSLLTAFALNITVVVIGGIYFKRMK